MKHQPSHDPSRSPTERAVVSRIEDVPAFANECEEQEYWSTHELAAELFERRAPDAEEAGLLARARARRARPARPAAG